MQMRSTGAVTASAILTAGVVLAAGSTAAAKGGEVGGSGSEYFLSNSFSSTSDIDFTYGRPSDQVYVGDWDGDGVDTLTVRRGSTFHVNNATTGGAADYAFKYGREGDVVLVGDWNEDGIDTLAVRRGNEYHIRNSLSGGPAEHAFQYGRSNDTILVGDWDGNGADTFAVRRGSEYHVKNSLSGGNADHAVHYGRSNDTVLVGDWDGDGEDTFTVRRGNDYHIANAIRGGGADRAVTYGRDTDTALAGDWNGDGVDSLGIRRGAPPAAPAPSPSPSPSPSRQFGDGTHVVGKDVRAGTYRAPGGGDCYWERLSGLSGDFDDIIANSFGEKNTIVRIDSGDAGFKTEDCGRWVNVGATYPSSPASRFSDGTYVVGEHIRPGTYRAPGGDGCYWERLSGFSGEFGHLTANDFGSSNVVVTISSTDVGFNADDCGTWRRQ